MTVLGGVFDDNPPGGSFYDDSQVRGAEQAGTKFNVKTGALFFAEVQYSINQPALGELDRGNSPKGLPGVYKLGGWYDTGFFPDQRLDDTELSLADPNSSGNPKMRHGNFSIYGVFDQMIWRPDPDEARAIGIFARLMGAPGDRNLASFSVNGGIELKAPFKDRDDDTVGLGFGVAKVSRSAIKLDQDVNSFGTPSPVRFQRDLRRAHLSVCGGAVVAGAARFPIRLDPRRRDHEPAGPGQAHRQRGDLRRAHLHRVLNAAIELQQETR